ncbi:hypothetical protein ASG88_14725 [Nocardioides sp. Soil777]|nr:hypothetical protein ASG88_14725 [Nocardioides sp. Soil777]
MLPITGGSIFPSSPRACTAGIAVTTRCSLLFSSVCWSQVDDAGGEAPPVEASYGVRGREHGSRAVQVGAADPVELVAVEVPTEDGGSRETATDAPWVACRSRPTWTHPASPDGYRSSFQT